MLAVVMPLVKLTATQFSKSFLHYLRRTLIGLKLQSD